MSNTNIDRKSFNFLKSLYEYEECSFKDLAKQFGVKDICELPDLITIAVQLFSSGHLVIKHPELTFSNSFSLESYISACKNNSLSPFVPDCMIGILPKGRALVEERLQKQDEFNKQLEALQIIADSSLEHSKTAKQYAKSAQEQADSAKKQAEKSDKTSSYASLKANLSLFFSAVSVIGTLLANADKIVHNVQKILSHLNMLIH